MIGSSQKSTIPQIERARALLCCALLVLAAASRPAIAEAAATIVILNGNAPNVGFNDPDARGAGRGQPRYDARSAAPERVPACGRESGARTLNSGPIIIVLATMEPLSCNATSAVLGSAGPRSVWRDFTGAPFGGTWYHASLANSLFGSDLDGGTDYEIRARFNSNLGQTGCLTGVPFYLGLDNNHGTAVDLVAVLLHEFGHGLGFSTTTSGTSGAQLNDGTNTTGYPSSYDHFLFDNTQGLFWTSMTNAQRAQSALNSRRVAWTGANVSAGVPVVLQPGTPELTATAPASIAATYLVGTAQLRSAGHRDGLER